MNIKRTLKSKKTKLKEITTKIGSGATPRGGKESYKSSGITLIRSLNVYDFNFEYGGLAFIDESQAQKLSNVEVKQNDILLNITGASVARCCVVPNNVLPARVNQHVAIVRINPVLANPYYVYYSINSNQYKKHLLALAQGGATREALTKDTISDFEISLPLLSVQNKIASILSAYDDLIENNTIRIKILESMAQTLYQEWFVKFRFPGYKQVKMVESELGLIPEGWEVVQIGDVSKVGRGSSPRPIKDQKYFEGGTIPWIKIADATKSGKYLYDTKQKVNEYGASFSRLMPKGSMILATSGTLGYTQILGVEGCIHDGWLYLENYKGINQEYLYYVLLSKQQFFYNSAYGAAIQNINTTILRETKIILPSVNIQGEFTEFTVEINRLIDTLGKKNTNLRKTRDLLLPKLISGQIDVENLDIDTGELAA